MGAEEDQQNEKPRGKSISQAQFVSWKRQKVTFIYIYIFMLKFIWLSIVIIIIIILII